MANPTIYIFVNKGLGMSAGKLAAQASHAIAMVMLKASNDRCEDWLRAPHRTILVMEARDEQHLNNIYSYLFERSIGCEKIIDEGVNEIDPHVCTAIATDVLDKDDENTKLALSTFKLYRDTIRLKVEVDR